jgi:uridine kinase
VEGVAFESISTWRQPLPATASVQRTRLVEHIADRVVSIRQDRLRVIVDGYTASGKTTFGHELAAAIRGLGRSTMRASFDDFKKPWRDAREKGYNRETGEGYYRNAPDFESALDLLLVPSGPDGHGRVVLCAHDPLTGVDHRTNLVEAPTDSVLIVDSVFGMRPEYNSFWDLRIWLDVPPSVALDRAGCWARRLT